MLRNESRLEIVSQEIVDILKHMSGHSRYPEPNPERRNCGYLEANEQAFSLSWAEPKVEKLMLPWSKWNCILVILSRTQRREIDCILEQMSRHIRYPEPNPEWRTCSYLEANELAFSLSWAEPRVKKLLVSWSKWADILVILSRTQSWEIVGTLKHIYGHYRYLQLNPECRTC